MRVEGNGEEPKVPVQLSVVAESRPQNPWVGLLARKVRIVRGDSGAASPSPARGRVVFRSDVPSLTVAGPRRICTGLPRYALMGTQGRGDGSTVRWRPESLRWARVGVVDGSAVGVDSYSFAVLIDGTIGQCSLAPY
jgi:hypothetical protein